MVGQREILIYFNFDGPKHIILGKIFHILKAKLISIITVSVSFKTIQITAAKQNINL